MQEKINKVALKFAKKNSDLYETSNYGSMYFGFINGAKWQQEQFGKSEFIQKLRGTLSDAEARRLIFEQFKNK